VNDLHDCGKRVGDEQCPDSGPGNDDQFRWLEQHADLAVLHQIAAGHGSQNDKDSNDCEHFKEGSLSVAAPTSS
jgi:hypothetical protein